MIPIDDILINSVVFGEEALQISYLDKSEQTEEGGFEHMLTISLQGYEALVSDIQSALGGVIEEFHLKLRNPPDEIPSGPRLNRTPPPPPDPVKLEPEIITRGRRE